MTSAQPPTANETPRGMRTTGSSSARGRACGAAAGRADRARDRHRPLVEREHHLALLHPPAVLSPPRRKSRVRRISQRAARLSARPLARPPSGASCRSRGANAPVARPGDAGFARRGVLVRPAGRGAAVLSFGLPSGMGRRPAVVRRARLLRARARDDESLRPALQPAPVQRRLSRGAPCASVSALDAAADVPRSSRARQPLAGAIPLARRRRVDPAGAPGAAIAGAAAVPAARAREGIPRAVDAGPRARRHSPTDCDRRWRAVPAHRAGAPPDSSARAAHDRRRESRAPERCA